MTADYITMYEILDELRGTFRLEDDDILELVLVSLPSHMAKQALLDVLDHAKKAQDEESVS
tara:strand:- start:590 stop:772 length:183 start_codon:yes stop_codon:yes gene_type:complete